MIGYGSLASQIKMASQLFLAVIACATVASAATFTRLDGSPGKDLLSVGDELVPPFQTNAKMLSFSIREKGELVMCYKNSAAQRTCNIERLSISGVPKADLSLKIGSEGLSLVRQDDLETVKILVSSKSSQGLAMEMENDMRVRVRNDDGEVLWTFPSEPRTNIYALNSDHMNFLRSGESIHEEDMAYYISFDENELIGKNAKDTNLNYHINTFPRGDGSSSGYVITLEKDGMLKMRNDAGVEVWTSKKRRAREHGPYVAVVTKDGEFRITDTQCRVVWSKNILEIGSQNEACSSMKWNSSDTDYAKDMSKRAYENFQEYEARDREEKYKAKAQLLEHEMKLRLIKAEFLSELSKVEREKAIYDLVTIACESASAALRNLHNDEDVKKLADDKVEKIEKENSEKSAKAAPKKGSRFWPFGR